MSATGEPHHGVWASLRQVLATFLAIVQNRVELFAVELQEEKCRLMEALLCAAAVAAFGMMSLAMVTFTLITIFWEQGRLAVLVGLTLIYLAGTAWAWRALQVRLKSRSAFAGTLGELNQDRSSLESDR